VIDMTPSTAKGDRKDDREANRPGNRAGGHEDGRAGPDAGTTAATNRLVLVGRLTAPPTVRDLPSGDELVTFRLSVARTATPGTARSRLRHDWFDCSVWGGRVRASARGWAAGDVVRLEGVLRRRYLTGAAGGHSRVEVEVLAGRRLTRAADGDQR
jgi:single-strand DNA-binding protein